MKNISIENLIKEEKEKPYSDIEKTRDIYLKMADFYTYDELFIYSMNPDHEFNAYTSKLTLEELEKMDSKAIITCRQVADNLCEVLNRLNINAYNIGYNPNKKKHVTTIVEIGDKKYALNLSQDLMCIQKGFKTKYFANQNEIDVDDKEANEVDMLDENELKNIDNKIGYCKSGLYMNDAIEMLKREMNDDEYFKEFLKSQNPNLNKKDLKKELLIMYKLDFIFKYLKNNIEEDKKMGIYETHKYYRKLIYELFTEQERNEVDISGYLNFVYAYDKKKEKTLVYQAKIGKEYKYYVYDKNQGHFVKSSLEEIKKEDIEPYTYQNIQGLER